MALVTMTVGDEVYTSEVVAIKRVTGVAGQIAYTATINYTCDGLPIDASVVTFVGYIDGPVVMVNGEYQTFVESPARFGVFSRAWVRRFFGED